MKKTNKSKISIFNIIVVVSILLSLFFVSGVWTASLNKDIVFYYTLNETSGSIANESVDGIVNITGLVSNWTTGIIGNGHWLSTADNSTGMGVNMTQFGVNWTMNFWLNRTGAMVSNGRVFDTAGDDLIVFNPAGSTTDILIELSNSASNRNRFLLGLGRWYMFTVTRNDTGTGFYINGTLNNTGLLSNTRFTIGGDLCFFSERGATDCINNSATNLIIDEIGFWNKSLSNQEITNLYNGGLGSSYDPNVGQVVLDIPTNDTITPFTNLSFTATITPARGVINVTNATLYLYYSNGSLFNNTVVHFLTGLSNTTNLNVTNLPVNNLLWNVLGCWNNTDTTTECFFGDSNFSLSTSRLLLSEFFNNQTTEGNTELFQVNITIPSGEQISTANLIYNNSIFSGTILQITGEQDNFSISKKLEIENVLSDVNVNFNWNISYNSNFNFGTTIQNQSILALTLDSCGTNSIVVINYTIRDERDRTLLNSPTDNVTIEVELDLSPLGSTNPIIEFNQTFNFVNNSVSVCINDETINNSEFRMDALTRYQALNHVSEFHNIQNFTLKNNTIYQNVTLHDLNTSQSQEFLITFKDDTFLPVSNALIDITRKYIGDGVFRSVEVPKTDNSGETIAHLVLSDVVYTFIVKKEGKILGTFDNIVAFCDNQATGDCKINLNTFGAGIQPEDFSTSSGVAYTLTYNDSTRDIVTIFTTLDGSSQTILLNATVFNAGLNTTICTDSLTSSSGTLTCNVPTSFGNVTIFAELSKNGVPIANKIFIIKPSASSVFGVTRIIIALILFITLPLMALTSGAATIILGVLGLITAAMLNLYESGGFFGVGATILWAVIMAGVILWKISQR